MDSKTRLLLVASQTLTTLALNTSDVLAQAPKKAVKEVECFGIHSCKGKNDCGVGQEQIDLANRIYNNKFTSSSTFECKGNALGSAAEKHLAWVAVKEGKEACLKQGGFVFTKKADKKLQIEDKTGVKS